jgi:hypothetical protein
VRTKEVLGVRTVTVDPSGLLMHPWMGVICEAETGVCYDNQTGGVRTLPRSAEGYYVPVFDAQALADLRAIFEDELHMQGVRHGIAVLDPYLDRIRNAVAMVRMDPSLGGPGQYGAAEAPLQLDDARLPEADEAWLPVVTPDGPGILIWENSD